MTDQDAARARLRAVLGQYVTEPAELDAVFGGAPFLETISLDSIALLHLVEALEEEYAVRFDELSMDRAFADVGSLLEFLCDQPTGRAV
ncbi:MAG TPA: hypothetical protein VMV60_05070 [Thermoanaerobaculia bacterium]|nr:hypothetical protein [Thermoanaerobaculia bacterium]